MQGREKLEHSEKTHRSKAKSATFPTTTGECAYRQATDTAALGCRSSEVLWTSEGSFGDSARTALRVLRCLIHQATERRRGIEKGIAGEDRVPARRESPRVGAGPGDAARMSAEKTSLLWWPGHQSYPNQVACLMQGPSPSLDDAERGKVRRRVCDRYLATGNDQHLPEVERHLDTKLGRPTPSRRSSRDISTLNWVDQHLPEGRELSLSVKRHLDTKLGRLGHVCGGNYSECISADINTTSTPPTGVFTSVRSAVHSECFGRFLRVAPFSRMSAAAFVVDPGVGAEVGDNEARGENRLVLKTSLREMHNYVFNHNMVESKKVRHHAGRSYDVSQLTGYPQTTAAVLLAKMAYTPQSSVPAGWAGRPCPTLTAPTAAGCVTATRPATETCSLQHPPPSLHEATLQAADPRPPLSRHTCPLFCRHHPTSRSGGEVVKRATAHVYRCITGYWWRVDIWAALNSEVLRADGGGEVSMEQIPECSGGGKREIPEKKKNNKPAASSGTIPTCKNPGSPSLCADGAASAPASCPRGRYTRSQPPQDVDLSSPADGSADHSRPHSSLCSAVESFCGLQPRARYRLFTAQELYEHMDHMNDTEMPTVPASMQKNANEFESIYPSSSSTSYFVPEINSASSVISYLDFGHILSSRTTVASLTNEQKYQWLINSWVPSSDFTFPMQNRSFQWKLFEAYEWLTYSQKMSGGLRKMCIFFRRCEGGTNDVKHGKLVVTPINRPIYKEAVETLRHHASIGYHKGNMIVSHNFLMVMEGKCTDVTVSIKQNKTHPYHINCNLLWSTDIPMRGHRDDGDLQTKTEKLFGEGKLKVFLKFRLDGEDESLASRIVSFNKNATQNEIIQSCGDVITEKVVTNINNSKYFTMMADKTTDISVQEQLAICMRYCDTTTYEILDKFFKFIDVVDATEKNIARAIFPKLEKLNLDISYFRGQANGAQVCVARVQPLAFYSHCASHNKACTVASIRNAVGVISSVANFFRESVGRIHKLEEEMQDGLPQLKKKETRP
ncbi:hypothetical protein PR048_014506 [Dryococelus australis]|uniref:DUF4371 domain-containing protein n=1 Tax=Dryococelus australis TaxID=614101 RepID=A0ABQ9HEK1_9NEOP|nr:hypothetical protein PR048_014506 [Dryococelus australis]